MDKFDFSLLKRLSEGFGPSGQEDEIRDIISAYICDHVDTLRIDSMGNLIATKGKADSVFICAHMDEVGLMITGICENGTLRFSSIGGIDPKLLPSKRVVIGTKKIPAVVGAVPVHLNKKEEKKLSFSDLYLDFGAKDRKDAERMVSVGDCAVFDTSFDYLYPTQTLKGKALDNRIGCYILCHLIASGTLSNGTFAFTVQEETGLRGAAAVAETLEHEFCIVLDSTTANDLPCVWGADRVCSQGKGGVISFADGATVYNRELILSIFEQLNKKQICAQTKSKRTGGNEASALQKSLYGKQVISLSAPCRYIHGPIASVQIQDINSTEEALLAICEMLSKKEATDA